MNRNGPSSTIYCGNLPPDFRDDEVEKLFGKYGRIASHDIKRGPHGSVFAFVEFEDIRDAVAAVHGRRDYEFVRAPGVPLGGQRARARARLAAAAGRPLFPSRRRLAALTSPFS